MTTDNPASQTTTPKEALIAILIDEGVLRETRGVLPNGTSTHGRCCTCQDCRHFFDECVCQHNRVWRVLEAINE